MGKVVALSNREKYTSLVKLAVILLCSVNNDKTQNRVFIHSSNNLQWKQKKIKNLSRWIYRFTRTYTGMRTQLYMFPCIHILSLFLRNFSSILIFWHLWCDPYMGLNLSPFSDPCLPTQVFMEKDFVILWMKKATQRQTSRHLYGMHVEILS